PTTQHVWLDLPPAFAFHAEVSVYNSVGQLVQRHTQYSSHEPLRLPHPPGLYIIEARRGESAVRAKVVVR
ncbi:MAG: T9SS C-terminal target domain-containing protein, partial [Cryomorphaceae bacterium]